MTATINQGNKHIMKKPKRGGKPKRITTKNPPGGPLTPGAKKKSRATSKGGATPKHA